MNYQQTPPKKLTDKWVWRSNTASIAAGQFSVLAVFETITVLILYYFLAYYFDYQWWLYLSALATPLILLRSSASVEKGVKQLYDYDNKDKDDLTKREAMITVLLATLASFSISYVLADIWLIHYQGWELFWRAAIVGAVAVAFAGAVSVAVAFAGVFSGAFAFAGAFAFSGAVAGAFSGVGVGAFSGAFAGVGAFSGAFAVVVSDANANAGMGSDNRILQILLAPFLILSFISVGFGIWLRSLFIRITSTLYYPIKGLRQLPDNLVEILWMIDLSHPPELLPQAKQVDPFFSFDGILKGASTPLQTIISICIAILWYTPALLWRWSLKATLWLWWPIAFILRSPFTGKTVANMRDITALRVHSLSQWLIVLALAVMVWLLLSLFPQLNSVLTLLPEQIQNFHSQLNINFAPLPLGLRYIALWSCCLLTVVVWVMSRNIAILHKTPIEDETRVETLNPERKATFIQRAKHLEIVHTWRIVAFILLGYSMVLYLAHQYYPTELMRFIPASLPAYL